MKKLLLGGLLAVGLGLAGVFAWSEFASWQFHRRFESRMTYWRSVVNSEVRVGERVEDAQAWLARRFPAQRRPAYDPADPKLVAAAESIDDTRFGCAAWVILIEIGIDPDGRVASRKVTSGGICL